MRLANNFLSVILLTSLVQLSLAISCENCEPGYECDTDTGACNVTCSIGTYNPGGSQLNCISCPQGHYCIDKASATPCPFDRPFSRLGEGECLECPAGQACEPGQPSTLCPGGTYALEGYGVCLKCPKGYECPDRKKSPQPCPSGSCTPCKPGQYCTASTDTPLPCSLGTYSGFAATECTVCPAGSYCPNPKLGPFSCLDGEYSLPGQSLCTRCEAGRFCPKKDEVGAECSPGTYSLSGETECNICPGGYYCPDRSKAPTALCKLGTYSLAGDTSCRLCPKGKMCTYLTMASGDCDDNYYQPPGLIGYCKQCEPGYECSGIQRVACSEGKYSIGMSKCRNCPAGSYCPLTTREPLPCSSGTYCPSNSVSYIFCPAGKYCADASIPPVDCPSGTYSIGKQSSCIQCPEGYYCPVTNSAPLLCPLGSYTQSAGATSCSKCSAGKYCAGSLLAHVRDVPEGFYSYEGMSYYIQCLPGYTCSVDAGPQSLCEAGTYYNEVNGCIDCPEGEACPTIFKETKYKCPSGTYSRKRATYCELCEAGYYCATAVAMIKCPSGTFSQPGATSCKNCPEGYYCPYSNAPHVLPCPAGTYSTRNSAECTICKAGTHCAYRTRFVNCASSEMALKGSHFCISCPGGSSCKNGISMPCSPGYYSTSGQIECQICPIATYCPRGITKPISCPAGTYNDQTGQALCKACPMGTYSLESASICSNIEPGKYSPTPYIPPRPCPLGTYSEANAIKCIPCPPGKYCAPYDDPVPQDCPAGFYCNYVSTIGFGGVGRIPCPAGTYMDLPGKSRLTDCRVCPIGFYCLEASVNPSSCPKGHVCPQGTKHPYEHPCPPGTMNPDMGQSSEDVACVACHEKFYCPSGSSVEITCPPGYYCPAGSGFLDNNILMIAGKYTGFTPCGSVDDAANCPAGAYCPIGTVFPILCPPGTYSDAVSAKSKSACIECRGGIVCDKYGTTTVSAKRCPKGYYCPKGSEYLHEYPCPPGTYNDDEGKSASTDCLPCKKGYACNEATNSDTNPMKKCHPGYYCPGGSATTKDKPCPGGTYSTRHELSSINECDIKCDEGYYCNPGSDRISGECLEGYYCPEGSSLLTMIPCPYGTYSNKQRLKDKSQCTICPKGHYCPSASTKPLICPGGTYNDKTNQGASTDCKDCVAGYYCPEGSTSMTECGFGSYSPQKSRQCFLCQPGYVCDSSTTDDQITTHVCPAGYYCPRGTLEHTVNKYLCLAGYYCVKGSSSPTICSPGTISTEGSVACTTALEGGYSASGSEESTGTCLAGYYCLTGSSSEDSRPCPQGTYSNSGAKSLTDCKACPVGFYCLKATAIPIICPQGYYCPEKTFDPLKCPIGGYGASFGLKSSNECTLCPEGTYCSLPGLPAPEGLCDAGYFCVSGANTSTPTYSDAIGNICPPGGFCETGSRSSKYCPPGRYNPNPGGRDLEACVLCPPGKYCSGDANANYTGECKAGYYCPSGSYMEDMYPAPPGHYTLTGNATTMECEEGTYNPYYAQETCLKCPAGLLCRGKANTGVFVDCPEGHYCPEGSINPTMCKRSMYNPNKNRKSESDCILCPPGKYCAIWGLAEPGDGTDNDADCDAGYFCRRGAISKTPETDESGTNAYGPCEIGHYCPKGIDASLPCPPGTYSDEIKLISKDKCKSCIKGYYCDSSGLSAPKAKCPEGYICPEGSIHGKNPINICGVNHYCPEGSYAAVKCAAGTYQDEEGQSSCKICSKGFYCLQGDTQYMRDCPPGYYCPEGTGAPDQYPCSIGRYNPATNAHSISQCILCDPGHYCSGTGSSSVTGLCSEGYYCKLGSPTPNPPSTEIGAATDHGGICTAGTYAPAGSSVCIKCPGGKYCERDKLNQPSGNCLAGYYCQLGSTTPTPNRIDIDKGARCTKGHYCPEGSDSPIPCPPGTFSASEGNTNLLDCHPCPSGRYCQDAGAIIETGSCDAGYYCTVANGATIGYRTPNPANQLCPIGYYCPSGTDDKRPCENQYQDLKGQAICKDCLGGYYCDSTTMKLCESGKENLSYYCPYDVMKKINCPTGTYNMKDGSESISDCLACPIGNYCPVSDVLPKIIPCKAGYYCRTPGASTEEGDGACPAGYYCPEGTQDPIPCPPGHFCNAVGMTTESLAANLCSAGYICYGKSISPKPTDGITGVICPAGHYCLEGAISPIACSIGKYRSSEGGKLPTDCLPCLEGYSCPRRGIVNPTIACPAGYYCPKDGTKRIPCPIGTRCPSGSSAPEVCPDKTYQNIPNSVECISCPARFYCKNNGDASLASKPRECPEGYYCPERTSEPSPCPISTFGPRSGLMSDSECDVCPAGYYCATEGLTKVTGKCSEGYYCTGKSKTDKPKDSTGNICTKGHYCPKGSVAPIPCPPGTYSDASGLTKESDCTVCIEGYYCPLRGATSMNLKFGASTFKCLAGFICLSGSSIPNPTDGIHGKMCEAGYYCPVGSAKQIPCRKGFYNPNEGQSDCIKCPAGKLCKTEGLSIFESCPAGYYCTEGSYYETRCPQGTYSPFMSLESASECIDCDPGKYCTGGKAAPDGPCGEGYVCPSKASTNFSYAVYSPITNTPGQCPMGYTCPEESSAPVPCPVGKYKDTVGLNECKLCPKGKYCDELGLISPYKRCAAGHICVEGATHARPIDADTEGGHLCSQGHYCPEGTEKEIMCEAGTFEKRTGSTSCQVCPAGYYCNGTDPINPTICPKGFYCSEKTIIPIPCPDGRFGAHEGLEKPEQCLFCPSGRYCKRGVIAGNCNAGYYCDIGASSQSDANKLCPVGHYCEEGAKTPTSCRDGKYNMQVGAPSAEFCVDCSHGYYCVDGHPTPIECPVGHYCVPPANSPTLCPIGTYQPNTLATDVNDCKKCPAGTYCYEKAIYDYTMYPCPVGKYCLGSDTEPIDCPVKTYRNTTGAASESDCLTCPLGYYCESGTIHPKPCEGGYYCDSSISEDMIICPEGRYCPPISKEPLGCPAAYYCEEGSETYTKCENNYFCPENTSSPIPCPSGYTGSYNSTNIDTASACIQCAAGYYSHTKDNVTSCIECTEGYLCYGQTNTSTPTDVERDGGEECPVGYYCPIGSYAPLPCPPGTYNPKTKGVLADCLLCPKGMFNPHYSASNCSKCGTGSISSEDGTKCICKAKYRTYQTVNEKCLCQPQYMTEEDNPDIDCQPIIYDRCANNEIRDPLGKCRSKEDCPECSNGQGIRSSGIGVCECVKVDILDNVCDEKCRDTSLKLTINYVGDIIITDPANAAIGYTILQSSIPKFYGRIHFNNENSKIVSMSLGDQRGFSANYQPTEALQKLYSDAIKGKALSRLLQATVNEGIVNPILCLNNGDTVMFELNSANSYPVYDKDNLLNMNTDFDYSPFLVLANKLANGETITEFGFTFSQPGIYVFKNSVNEDQITIIGVMASNEKCSDPKGYIQPISTSNLLKLGLSQNEDIILTPDWGLMIGVVLAIFIVVPLLIWFIQCFVNTSWIKKELTEIKYREVDKDDNYDEYAPKGKEWKRESLKAPEDSTVNVIIEEDHFANAKPNEDEKAIVELRKKEDMEGVNEISPDIFRDLYKELKYHSDFVKKKFFEKAGLDTSNIRKVFKEVDEIKLMLQQKLKNVAKLYGNDFNLIFEGEEVKDDSIDDEAEDKKSVKSKNEEEEIEIKIKFNEDLIDQINDQDKEYQSVLANQIKEQQDAIQEESAADSEGNRKKFIEDLNNNTKLSPEERQRLLGDYDKANSTWEKLLKVEAQNTKEKLDQMLEQRRKKRECTKVEIKALEEEKDKINERLRDVNATKIQEDKRIDEENKREEDEADKNLENKKKRSLQESREKYQDKMSKCQSKNKRDELLSKFTEKMGIMEDELEEERKTDMEKIKIKLELKRQKKKAELEAKIKKMEDEIKGQHSKRIEEINDKITILNNNLQNEQIEDAIRKVQEEESEAPEEDLAEQITKNRLKEEQLNKELDQDIQQQKKKLAQEEQDEICKLHHKKDAEEEKTYAETEVKKRELEKGIMMATSDADKKALKKELEQIDAKMAELVETDLTKQDTLLKEKIAQRKRRIVAKEGELKANKQKQLDDLKDENRKCEEEIKQRINDERLKRQIEKLQMTLHVQELPFAVEKLVDEKQLNDFSELLKRQLEDKAKALKESMHNLIKEKAEAIKQAKEEIDIQIESAKKMLSNKQITKNDYEAKLKKLEEEKAEKLKEVEYNFTNKQGELEQKKLMDIEKKNSEELLQLMNSQADEKQRYMQGMVSDQFMVKLLVGDKEQMAREIEEYKAELDSAFAKRSQEIEEKRRLIEETLINDTKKIKELEAQAQKLADDQELRQKKRDEKKKLVMEAQLASREEELKKKGVAEEEVKRILEKHQKELDNLQDTMDKERIRQVEIMKNKVKEKLKERELLKKQREEQLLLMKKEEEKRLDDKVKAIEKERRMESEEEKVGITKVVRKYETIKKMFDKVKPAAGVPIDKPQKDDNLLHEMLDNKQNNARDSNKIDVCFELLSSKIKQISELVSSTTGLQFKQIASSFETLNEKIDNMANGSISKIKVNSDPLEENKEAAPIKSTEKKVNVQAVIAEEDEQPGDEEEVILSSKKESNKIRLVRKK